MLSIRLCMALIDVCFVQKIHILSTSKPGRQKPSSVRRWRAR